MNSLKLIGKILFLLFTIFYTLIPFIIVLETKINKPHFKNLNNTEFLLLGIVLIVFIIININMFYPSFKKKIKS
jgi:hypothetical protein